MNPLSPSWAFSGQAIHAVGDAHLAPGMHFRVATNPFLGLPVVPIVVSRITLGEGAKGRTRRDVTWVDARGTVLSTPFTVTPDNPVTGSLPPGETCCWASLEARATAEQSPVLPERSPVIRPHAPPTFGRGGLDLAAGLPRRRLQGQGAFRVEGVVATPLGDAPVAIRSRAPYHVYASHIERVLVRGSGTVTGLAWLPASAVEKAEPFRTLPLPTVSGGRYAGPLDGRDQGFDRVLRGAPQRFGMHESALAVSPTACNPVSAAEEDDRVRALVVDPERALNRLVNDMSAAQRLLTAAETVLDENGRSLGTSQRFILMDLLQGAVDPGVARWLGFLDVDEQVPGNGIVVAYVVDALFAPDWRAIRKRRLQHTLPGDAVVEDGVEALLRLAERAPEVEKLAGQVQKMRAGPYLVGRVVLAATGAVPLDPPAGPVMGSPTPGDWLPAPAPTAIRELTVDLESLVPAAGLASAIAQPAISKPAERNPKDTAGRRLLLTAGPDPATVSATSGGLADRIVDEQDGTWQLAQLDWFGRWSGWSVRVFGTATRPRPPRPVVTLTTRAPALPTPSPTDARSGTVRIEVSVPPVAALPAGGRLLKHLKLTVTAVGGVPTLTTHPVPGPSAPPEVMVIEVPGPPLLPTQSATVTVTAVWTDSDDIDSDVSEPKRATLHDPRPPAPVVMAPALTYTARPDATGRARTTLAWTVTAGQTAYRVFVADETTLRAKLGDVAAGVLAAGDAGQAPTAGQAQFLLAELDAADAPARGALWDANRHLLPRRWWLQLTAEPVPAPAGGSVAFHHDVSGSLVVLVLYRVVAVSAASVESDFRTSPLLPRGVPNVLVPPAPAVQVLPVVNEGNLQARLTVTVPGGPTPAVWFRLRRATATTDTAFMPVVAEGIVPARPAGDTAAQVFEIIDTGSSPSGPRTSLSAWLRYTWRVEVRGAPAPGGGPVGEWSSASAPVTTTTMPPSPPAPVANLSVTRDPDGVHVRFTQPETLAAGGTTGYTVDVYRQLAGAPLRLFHSLAGQAPPPVGRGSDITGSFHLVDAEVEAVAGTRYRVVVTDPIGRTSKPSSPLEAP